MRITFIIFAFCIIAACNSDSSEVNAFVKEKVKKGETGSFANPLSPGNSPMAVLLQQQFWVFEFYINPDLKKVNRTNKGRWYQFMADGTFLNGHWEEQTGHGSWFLTTENDKTFLLLDNIDNKQDVQFEIQDTNDAEDAMSWIGVKGYPEGGAIIKVIQLLSRPTKAQFGVQE